MNKKGFTMIELLVVIAIIAIVGVSAAIAVNIARSQQRDAIRLSHVSQMQTALENFFNEKNSYPLVVEELPLGDSAQSACLSTSGFMADCSSEEMILLRIVTPTFAKGLDGAVVCGTPTRNAFCYSSLLEGNEYKIEFELENGLAQVGLQKGVNCANANGMKAGRCN
jgi:prepilin-type N-terminal cleavage/methylation domain-containing protein